MPSESLEIAFVMRIARVSTFFPDVTQQTHSFFASGVMSAHVTLAFLDDAIARRKSAGALCIEREDGKLEHSGEGHPQEVRNQPPRPKGRGMTGAWASARG
jgi:hypothetical protein